MQAVERPPPGPYPDLQTHTTYEPEHDSSLSEHQASYHQAPPDRAMSNPFLFRREMKAEFPKPVTAPAVNGIKSPPATPSKLSLPLGHYDEMRPYINKQRNKEYNQFKQKYETPRTKRDRVNTSTPPNPANLSLGNMGYYDEMRPALNRVRNEEYNKFLTKLPPMKARGTTPASTNVCLPVGQYDELRPMFESERNDEYNKLLETGSLSKRNYRQTAPTPPEKHGLPIGQKNYDHAHKAMEFQRNREYNEFLNKKYGGGVTRGTRSEPGKPSKPMFHIGNDAVYDQKRQNLDDERHREYNQFLKQIVPPRARSIEIPKDVDSGLPIGQQHHEVWKNFLREQRNREYNQLVEKQKTQPRNRDWPSSDAGFIRSLGDDGIKMKKRELNAERRRDYNDHIAQQKTKEAPRREDYPGKANGPFDGLFQGLGDHGNSKETLGTQRKQEYNDRLEQQYGGSRERQFGRPNFVKDSAVNGYDRGRSPARNGPDHYEGGSQRQAPDQYEQMLHEKRRQEAQRRRYDPEFEGRAERGDPNDQARYAY